MAEQLNRTTETQTGDENEIHACRDVSVPLKLLPKASELAMAENPVNRGEIEDPTTGTKAFVVTSKLWKPGRTLRVAFMGGTPEVQGKVKQYANEWTEHIGISFDFSNHPDAEIRIAFVKDGSWSYIGTDCLTIAKDQATMNYGWFDKPVSESEYSRVIIHEFGHALGMPHEHNHPKVDIPWNKEAVYRYYMGSPNNWTKAQVDNNLFAKYDKPLTIHSVFDPKSIMLYPIPKEFVTDEQFVVGMNTALSENDKRFMGSVYPKS
jgi:Astacin (Peptidase family M12A)